MKATDRKSVGKRLGVGLAGALLALVLVGGLPTPAQAGGPHFSFSFGIPLPGVVVGGYG